VNLIKILNSLTPSTETPQENREEESQDSQEQQTISNLNQTINTLDQQLREAAVKETNLLSDNRQLSNQLRITGEKTRQNEIDSSDKIVSLTTENNGLRSTIDDLNIRLAPGIQAQEDLQRATQIFDGLKQTIEELKVEKKNLELDNKNLTKELRLPKEKNKEN